MVDQTSQFYAILTSVGAAKQANADALGIPWKITHMAVGDGNPAGLENPPLPMPDASARALLNEWRRAPLNQLKVDDKDNSIIVAEQVIPADVGGRWIREIALFDADGDMVAVANCAPTYKPLLSQGSGRTQVVRMNLIVSSSSNVQLKIDPSVVLATREWVTDELAKQDFKHSVLVATTAAITLSGLQTVDGVALTAGARVLVKHQAAAKDNGLYQVVAGGPWTRCVDADTSAKVTPGLLVAVEKGTNNADSAWQLVTDGPITLGVSGLAFEMAWGRTGVAAGTYRSVTVDAFGRIVAATNPTTVAGYGLTDVYTKTQVDQALVLKANLASPALTGVPTAPTAALGTNTAQLANTAFVQAAIAAIIASSPGALDTLNELAAAIGNDPNFASTMLNALAGKATKATTLGGYGITDGLPVFSFAPTDIAKVLDSSVVYQNPSSGHANGLGSTAGCVLTISSKGGSGFQLYGRDDKLLFRGHTGDMFSPVRTVFHSGNFDPVTKADLASPVFTGTPTAPTALLGANTTQLASTAFVQAALLELVRTALGGDASYAASMASTVALKAPLASPVFSGTPTVPTAAATANNLQIANTAFVKAAIASLIGAAPGALDTLNELATAIGNDPNFSATVLNALAGKANVATTLGGYGITDALPLFTSVPTDISKIIDSSVVYQNPSGGSSNALGPAAGCVLTMSRPGLSGWQLFGRDDQLLFRGHTANAYSPVRTVFHSGNLDPSIYLATNAISRQKPILAAPMVGLGADSSALMIREALEVADTQSADSYAPGIGFYWNKVAAGRLIMDTLGVLKWTGKPVLTGTIASQAETDQGVSDTAVVTPKKLRFGFAASWTINGYLILPSWLGGFTLQWGLAPASLVGGVQKNFVIPFPNKCLCIVGSPFGNLSSQFESSEFWGLTESSFNSANVAGQTNSYFAIGY